MAPEPGAPEPALEQPYLDLLREVLERGEARSDRTGVGTLGLFGRQLRFDLRRGFPAVTTKKLHWPAVVGELLWFLRGDTNVAWLKQHNIRIWDEWADADGELGPVYGRQWRAWPTPDGGHIDQLAQVVAELGRNPASRRLVVSAWNVADVPRMRLPPCHLLFQFHVGRDAAGTERLSCQLYQRSGDLFLGVPFNIASYALLTHLVAQVCGLQVGDFILVLGDAHVYANHLDAVRTQLARAPFAPPRLRLDPAVTHLDGFGFEHIALDDYRHHPRIAAPVAV